MNVIQFLASKGATVSMSEGRRLVACGVVAINGILESDMTREVKEGDLVSVGRGTRTSVWEVQKEEHGRVGTLASPLASKASQP